MMNLQSFLVAFAGSLSIVAAGSGSEPPVGHIWYENQCEYDLYYADPRPGWWLPRSPTKILKPVTQPPNNTADLGTMTDDMTLANIDGCNRARTTDDCGRARTTDDKQYLGPVIQIRDDKVYYTFGAEGGLNQPLIRNSRVIFPSDQDCQSLTFTNDHQANGTTTYDCHKSTNLTLIINNCV